MKISKTSGFKNSIWVSVPHTVCFMLMTVSLPTLVESIPNPGYTAFRTRTKTGSGVKRSASWRYPAVVNTVLTQLSTSPDNRGFTSLQAMPRIFRKGLPGFVPEDLPTFIKRSRNTIKAGSFVFLRMVSHGNFTVWD